MRTTVTDNNGQYRIVDLRGGVYTVTFTLAGFTTVKREGVQLAGEAIVTVNGDMRVGELTETVTVSGESPVVDLQSTTRQHVMTRDVIDTLPTGRNYTSLAFLLPGVNSSARDVGGAGGDTMSQLTIHGSKPGDQRVMQNGVNTMTLQVNAGRVRRLPSRSWSTAQPARPARRSRRSGRRHRCWQPPTGPQQGRPDGGVDAIPAYAPGAPSRM